MRFTFVAVTILSLAALASGCGGAAGVPETRPADFSITYSWQEGSVAPDFYSEYEITIGPGDRAEIRYRPTHPGQGAPVWKRSIALTPAQVADLYALARADDAFRERWERRDSPLVGGPNESATFLADGRRYEIPWDLTDAERASIAGLYPAIVSVVPESVWKELEAKRSAYLA